MAVYIPSIQYDHNDMVNSVYNQIIALVKKCQRLWHHSLLQDRLSMLLLIINDKYNRYDACPLILKQISPGMSIGATLALQGKRSARGYW